MEVSVMKFLPVKKFYYDPFEQIEQLQKDMNRFFDFAGDFLPEKTGSQGLWTPPIDVIEEKDKYIVKADIPGVVKEDIDVSVDHNVLTVSGKKSQEQKVEKEGYLRSERYYGAFQRSISLPAEVDTGKVTAEYKNGTLELTVPKREDAKPKQIKIDVK